MADNKSFEWGDSELAALFIAKFLSWLYVRPTNATLCACEISCDMRLADKDHRWITWPIRAMVDAGAIAEGIDGCGPDGRRASMVDGQKAAAYRLVSRDIAREMIVAANLTLSVGFLPLKPIEFDDKSKPHNYVFKQPHPAFVDWALLKARREMLITLLRKDNDGQPITICAARMALEIPPDIAPYFMSGVVTLLRDLQIIQYQEAMPGKSTRSHNGPRGVWLLVDEGAARQWLRDNPIDETNMGRPDPYTGVVGGGQQGNNELIGN